MTQAWALDGDVPEERPEHDGVVALAAEPLAALAPCTSLDERRDLSADEVSLGLPEDLLRFRQGQPDLLDALVPLVQGGNVDDVDFLAVLGQRHKPQLEPHRVLLANVPGPRREAHSDGVYGHAGSRRVPGHANGANLPA